MNTKRSNLASLLQKLAKMMGEISTHVTRFDASRQNGMKQKIKEEKEVKIAFLFPAIVNRINTDGKYLLKKTKEGRIQRYFFSWDDLKKIHLNHVARVKVVADYGVCLNMALEIVKCHSHNF